MGKFPVISISLKNAASDSFSGAKEMLCSIIGQEALRFPFLSESDRLSETEHRQYNAMIHAGNDGVFTIKDSLLKNSLLLLSRFLQKHYGQKTILLIDEYDVPLDYAYRSGYYDDMVGLVRTLFGAVFKTNDSLEFAVLTGCIVSAFAEPLEEASLLRETGKESIFTGLNNFKVYTVKQVRYKEYFGFTDAEVRQMLEYYGFSDQYSAVREWYDGYLFGNLGIYCPWDVINYCGDLRDGSVTEPQNYWVNTSSNDIIRSFLSRADAAARDEIELLINGGHVKNGAPGTDIPRPGF